MPAMPGAARKLTKFCVFSKTGHRIASGRKAKVAVNHDADKVTPKNTLFAA